MSNDLVYRDSKVLVAISPTTNVNGVDIPYVGSYTVAIAPIGTEPTGFISPATDSGQSGVWIGPTTTNVTAVGQVWQCWWQPTGTTQIPVTSVQPLVQII